MIYKIRCLVLAIIRSYLKVRNKLWTWQTCTFNSYSVACVLWKSNEQALDRHFSKYILIVTTESFWYSTVSHPHIYNIYIYIIYIYSNYLKIILNRDIYIYLVVVKSLDGRRKKLLSGIIEITRSKRGKWVNMRQWSDVKNRMKGVFSP